MRSRFRFVFLVAVFQLGAVPALAAGDFNMKSCLLISGKSSFYGKNFRKEKLQKKAANGKRFNPNALTAAHRTLPFGTKVKVTDKETGRSVVVTITDRGPAAWTGRVLDLSYGAAKKLGMVNKGVTSVKVERADGKCQSYNDDRNQTDGESGGDSGYDVANSDWSGDYS